jgi:hypothetical protein
MPYTPTDSPGSPAGGATLAQKCLDLHQAKNRGDLGECIVLLVLQHSPVEFLRMKKNFSNKIQDITPEYRDRLAKKITEHLLGTYQRIRLFQQQGVFKTMHEPVTEQQKKYWDMSGEQCREDDGGDDPSIRFLKYLLAGDSVQFTGGVYYCPVREKANDVDAALCPFCPALQTLEIGYLRPPINPSVHRKQEFVEHCHKFHNFNG